MLSLYEILKASKTGIAPDMWTALAGMNWGGAGSGAETKEITGIPPLSIRSNGTMLLDYLISGNMSQTSTPTSDSPIQPQECGDLETTGEHAGQYKIPISSANTTTPVYLGEVQTTRKIKKLVLTGNETWERRDSCFRLSCPDSSNSVGTIISTHFKYSTAWALVNTASVGACVTATYYGTSYKFLMVRCDDIATTIADFKTYLQQQYAAGTPVTIWYVLAEPETGIVNEPLRKIGDYADTVSYEQAGVQIPTNKGNTVIDVDTTLKPSEMYIKYQE